ncbi:phosphoglucosamine mutase [Halobacteriales archaeon QS_8_69_26]|nr:MAG: phosphoglucosamine mutase [Halobacteriales archaeon QS_8_69_26]
MEVFGSSGVRGVANEELTPELAMKIAMAAGTVWDADSVAVARDTRTTGRMLTDAAAAGLAAVGASVDRLGVVPTPGAQAHAEREGIPLVTVTASHNPPEYNGIKLAGADGVELSVAALERVESVLLNGEFDRAPWDHVGDERRVDDARREYVRGVVAAVDRDRIADAGLTVALDPGHGAGSLTSPELFRRLGCRVLAVNAQPDGRFPGRDPEPVPENLADLGRLVRSTDADLGIAHDGDADRAIFYDETGEYIEGDATLAALAAAELDEGDVTVSAVNVSQRLVDVADEAGARLELTPIGSTRIVSRVQELRSAGESVPIAGEGNGGVFFPNYRLARDGGYVAARFLGLVADRPASEVVRPVQGYHNVRMNLGYDSEDDREAMLAAAATLAEEADADLDTTDGYRLDYGDAWVLARPSGTEPLVRIYAEATSEDRAETLAGRMRDAMLDAGG